MTHPSTEKKQKERERRRRRRKRKAESKPVDEGANNTTVSGVSLSASSTDASIPTSSSIPYRAPCYFLGLPLEIRLNIYRLLFLDPPSTFLQSATWRDIYNEGECRLERNAGGEGILVYGASDSEGSPRLETWASKVERQVRSMQSRARAQAPQRTPAILRTNRQIYTEASRVLYSGLQLVVKPEDALIRRDSPIVIESRKVSCPYDYRCRRSRNWKGILIPRILTRFQNVRYEAGFDLGSAPDLFISEDFQISDEDETSLVTYFKDAEACLIPALYIIQAFVDMLSTSPLINNLEVALSVKVPPIYSRVDTHRDGELGPIDAAKEEAVNLRAYELFLESGVLEPLKKLRNVKRFTFDFALVNHLPQRKLFQPKQNHLDIIDDLKTTIERNRVVKPAYPWREKYQGKKNKGKKKKARLSISASGGQASGR